MAVLKEKKNSVQIQCLVCDGRYWVKRGTLSHRTELCGKCSQKISGRMWEKMGEESEQED